MSKATEAVIFDADGMILAHHARFSVCLQNEYGIPLEKTTPFFEGVFQECLVGKADLKEELAKVIKAWGWKGGVEDITTYWFSPKLSPIEPRIIDEIKRLRAAKIRVYLATNNEKYRTNSFINERGFGELFDIVFSSSGVGAKKRSSEFLQHVLDTTGHIKENVQFWDDDPKNIEGIRAFGFDTYQYVDFDNFKLEMDKILS